jgi:peptide deformylase
MILPIVAYGAPVLRTVAKDIDANYPELQKLIADMWETMYYSQGVGVAAPQINKPIRLFVVDTEQLFLRMEDEEKEEYGDGPGIKRVFINAHVEEFAGEEWAYNEGCLSIPKIREDVFRPEEITLSYVDEHFQPHTETFFGLSARVIQHEYDHIDGKLFIDYLKPFKRKLLKAKLDDISKGKVSVDYKMTFPK